MVAVSEPCEVHTWGSGHPEGLWLSHTAFKKKEHETGHRKCQVRADGDGEWVLLGTQESCMFISVFNVGGEGGQEKIRKQKFLSGPWQNWGEGAFPGSVTHFLPLQLA